MNKSDNGVHGYSTWARTNARDPEELTFSQKRAIFVKDLYTPMTNFVLSSLRGYLKAAPYGLWRHMACSYWFVNNF